MEGHNVTLRKNKEDEIELYHDTTAFGFSSPNSTFYLEDVNEGTEDSPKYRTYVVIEDVYLWKRFDATKKIIEWNKEGIPARVSVELDQVSGKFDNDGYFKIEDYNLSGICVLGSDVEPCFNKAEIQMFTADEFKAELKTLMFELGSSSEQGGENMTKEKVEKDYEKTVVEQVEEVEVDELTDNEKVDETTDTTTETDTADSTEDQVVEEVETTPEAQPESASDNPEDSNDAPETFEDESTTEQSEEDVEKTDEADEVEVTDVEEVVDYESKFNELSTQHTSLQSEFTTLQSQLTELQSYKRKREEEDIQAKFEGKLTEEEFAQVFSEMKDADLSKVEEKLFALIGKKAYSAYSVDVTKNTNKIVIPSKKDDEYNPYGGII